MMKNRNFKLTIVFFFLLLCPILSSYAAEEPSHRVIAADGKVPFVFSKRFTMSEKLGKLKSGDSIYVQRIGIKWATVQYEGKTGYLTKKYLQKISSEEITIDKIPKIDSYSAVGYTHTVNLPKSKSLVVHSLPHGIFVDVENSMIGRLEAGDSIYAEIHNLVGYGIYAAILHEGKTGYVSLEHIRSIQTEDLKIEMEGYEKLGFVLIILLILLSVSLAIIFLIHFDYALAGKMLFAASGLFIATSVVAFTLGCLSLADYKVDAMFRFSFLENAGWFLPLFLGLIGLALVLGLIYCYIMSFSKILNSVRMQTSYFSCKFGVITGLLSAIAGMICYLWLKDYLWYVLYFFGATQLIQTVIILNKTAPKWSYGFIASLVLIVGPAGAIVFLAPLMIQILLLGLVVGMVAAAIFGKDRGSSKSNERDKKLMTCSNCYFFVSNLSDCSYHDKKISSYDQDNYYCVQWKDYDDPWGTQKK